MLPRLLNPWIAIPPKPKELEGIYGRNQESEEFQKILQFLGLLGVIQWKEFIRNPGIPFANSVTLTLSC
jgi:hypothetical protein